MPRIHWVARGTGTPKDKDEINKRETCECDGRVCDLDMMGETSIYKIKRRAEPLAKILPVLVLRWLEKVARR
jgi:hypothetical protein